MYDERVYLGAGMLFLFKDHVHQLYPKYEGEEKFVTINEIEKIKTFVATKEDLWKKGTERFIIQVYP